MCYNLIEGGEIMETENMEVMETQEPKKRTRRTISKEEKIAALNEKIAKHESQIADLKQQIEALNKPSVTMKDIRTKIDELGLSYDDVMKAVDKLAKK